VVVSSPADAPLSERLKLVRPLGGRGSQTWAALERLPDGKTRVVVVEKVPRGGATDDTEIADWIRDARRLATLEHPNLVRVRDVSITGDEVRVTSDYLDGARWSELGAAAAKPALETALRVLVDVLAGLSVMHNMRDASKEPAKLVHGDLTPEHVIVGIDGIARLVMPCRARGAGLRAERAGSAYLAPEILLGDESADARADIYSVGAMLWEALSGKALFAGVQPSAIVTQLLSGRVPKATVPAGSPWAAPLVEVASRAMSADPEKRPSSAAAMSAEIRRIAGVKLPAAMRVAAYVRGAHGDRIKARRQEIERGEAPERAPSLVPPPIEIEVTFDPEGRVTAVPAEPTPNATTRPPPPIEAAPPVVIPPAPAAPKGPPPLRTRTHTMAGVAPPPPPAAESTTVGNPVVVPSSRPPPPPPEPAPVAVPAADMTLLDAAPPCPAATAELSPLATVAVPPLAPVPADLVREVAMETRAANLEAPQPSPVPAMPPMVTPLDEPPPAAPPQRRRVPVVLIAVPVAIAAFAAATVVWWFASRGPEQAEATPSPVVPSATAVATPPPPAPTVVVSAAPTPAAEPAAPVASATAEPAPEAPSASAIAAPVVVAPPVLPARPPPRPHYEPEGI
jgi:serine/threonine-protein kinase